MDSQNAIEYLTHVDWRGSRLGLDRMVELLGKLDNPQDKLKFVHIAGTNGKGSTASMLSHILTAAGYKTGLYTSPFITRFNERMQIDGAEISDDALVRFTHRVRQAAETMDDHPTEFELVTVVAFLYFLESGCDIVVLEVGMGGRLDATNVIPSPEAALLAPISLDHTAELGDTVGKIAAEKGGILKPGTHAVMAPQPPEARAVLEQIAHKLDVPLTPVDTSALRRTANTEAGQVFDFKELTDLTISLLGTYQPENAALAVTAAQILRDEKGWSLPDEAIRQGLAAARWPARFEILHHAPTVIVDGGHNPQCIDSIVQNLKTYFPGRPMRFVVGVMADKDYQEMFAPALPLASRLYTVTPNNPRALDADDLAAFFKSRVPVPVRACGDVLSGLRAALQDAGDEEVICAFGSFFMAGPVREFFNAP